MLFAFAGSQEPITWRTIQAASFSLFEIVVVMLGITGIIASLWMLLAGILELIERRRASPLANVSH